MPAHLRCVSFMGQNVLLFRYIIAYDCKNMIPKYYKETHFKELFNKDGKIIKVETEDKIKNHKKGISENTDVSFRKYKKSN